MSHPTPHAEVTPSKERPLAVTLVCLWWFVVVPIGGLLAAAEVARGLSAPGASAALRGHYISLGLYLAVLTLAVICMIGLWQMKRWGMVGFGILFLIGQLTAILSNAWSIGGFLGWIVAVIAGLAYYRRLT